ncbi:MAG: PfkB family carbohydrate kinase [Marinibacterium sp.]|nr:PfkB family carbohydrate kinase [Marinibacterium sp.]
MRCVAVSSGVLSGHVGLGAVQPVLTLLGVGCVAVPSVILSAHAATPGVTRASGYGAGDVAQLLAGVGPADAVLTGYLRDGDTATTVADALERTRPALRVVDPVLGDLGPDGAGRLYLPDAVGRILRDRILPGADLTTPNRFELGWLTGHPVETRDQIIAAARRLPVACSCVTSVPDGDRIGILTVTQDTAWFAGQRAHDRHVNGAGDVTAALLLAGLLRGVPVQDAAHAATRALDVMLGAMGPDQDDLPVIRAAPRWTAAMAAMEGQGGA